MMVLRVTGFPAVTGGASEFVFALQRRMGVVLQQHFDDVGVAVKAGPVEGCRIMKAYPKLTREMMSTRPLLSGATGASPSAMNGELAKEQAAEQKADEDYWRPLKTELETMRLNRRKSN